MMKRREKERIDEEEMEISIKSEDQSLFPLGWILQNPSPSFLSESLHEKRAKNEPKMFKIWMARYL